MFTKRNGIYSLPIADGEPDYAKILRYRGFPAQLSDKRLADWKPYNDASDRARRLCKGFVDDWSSRVKIGPENGIERLGRGLAIVGPHSSGKTALACAVAHELARRKVSVFFVTVPDYVDGLITQFRLEDQIKRGDPRAVEQYWEIEKIKRRAYRSSLLVFDGMGTEAKVTTDMALHETFRLIHHRYRNARPTVVTARMSLTKWGDYYEEFKGFAFEAFDQAVLGGKDLRSGG